MEKNNPENKVGFSGNIVDNEFSRNEIDRGIVNVANEFSKIDKVGFLDEVINRLKKNKTINLLDCGCGTGRSLYELVDQLEFRTQNQENTTINALGINDKDYSQESQCWAVRNAIRDKKIDYLVSRIENSILPDESFDLIYSYETLIHNKNIVLIITNMWKQLKDGGVLYFNIYTNQAEEPNFKNLIKILEKKSFIKTHQLTKNNDTRVFYKIIKK